MYSRRTILGQIFSNLAFLIGWLTCGTRYDCKLVVLKVFIVLRIEFLSISPLDNLPNIYLDIPRMSQ